MDIQGSYSTSYKLSFHILLISQKSTWNHSILKEIPCFTASGSQYDPKLGLQSVWSYSYVYVDSPRFLGFLTLPKGWPLCVNKYVDIFVHSFPTILSSYPVFPGHILDPPRSIKQSQIFWENVILLISPKHHPHCIHHPSQTSFKG